MAVSQHDVTVGQLLGALNVPLNVERESVCLKGLADWMWWWHCSACATVHTHTHTSYTPSETRHCNLVLITYAIQWSIPRRLPFWMHLHLNPFYTPKRSITMTHVCPNFPRIQQPQTSGRQKGDMKQVAYRGPKYIRRQRSQFSRHDSCTSSKDLLSGLYSHEQHVGHPACPVTGDCKATVYPRSGHEGTKWE
jgi:hypothetical protein